MKPETPNSQAKANGTDEDEFEDSMDVAAADKQERFMVLRGLRMRD